MFEDENSFTVLELRKQTELLNEIRTLLFKIYEDSGLIRINTLAIFEEIQKVKK